MNQKSRALKILNGTHRPCRDKPHTPSVEALGVIPDPPEWLSPIAAAEWRHLCPRLTQLNVLTDLDLKKLEQYCSAYSDYRAADAAAREHGVLLLSPTGEMRKNPAITAKSEASKMMTSAGAALGLDPLARERIIVGERVDKESNPFLAM